MVTLKRMSGLFVWSFLCAAPLWGPCLYCQVFNVAVNQTTTQHTTLVYPTAGQNGSFEWTADKAVDDCLLRDAPEKQRCCSGSSTDQPNNHWNVTLARRYEIEMIRIYARNDQDDNQLKGFQLYLSEENRGTMLNETSSTAEDKIYTFTFSPPRNISVITINRPSAKILVLCEVQVFAVCNAGFYGPNCTQVCGGCLGNVACNRTTGVCPGGGCQPGYYNDTCVPCGNCLNNEICNTTDGVCPNGCAAGWRGDLCTDVCEAGFYGSNCLQECGGCLEQIDCNRTNGVCHGGCQPGYYNETCVKCGNCLTDEPCNTIDGVCPNGCAVGWRGKLCTEVCENGTYGLNCSETCGYCVDTCDHVDGMCSARGCWAGFHGNMCDQECDNKTYGVNCSLTCGNCLDGEQCHHVNGSCLNGCVAGFQPDICVEACSEGSWGVQCKNTCGKCLENSTCYHKDGECLSGCRVGLKGTRCMDECDNKTYGVNCSMTCGNCVDGEQCHHVTGSCLNGCVAGFLSDMCVEECFEGFWGVQCMNTCGNCLENSTCHHEGGACLSGCREGWTGTRCMDTLKTAPTPEDTHSNTALIGGVVGCVLAIIFIIAVAFVFWRRRIDRRRGTKENSFENYVNPAVNSDSMFDDGPLNQNESLYKNAQKSQSTTAISVRDLRDFCKANCGKYSPLIDEFRTLPYGLQYETREATSEVNKKKNRYRDMIAYDKNRICLPTCDGDMDSDYINASYIKGYTNNICYIASQGVMKNTVNEFWWMIWTQNVSTIVMLTQCYELGKLKSYQYWSESEEKTFGHISVSVIREEKYADFTVRHLVCKHKIPSSERSVTQFHYTAWPDKDIPDHPLSLVQFWRKIRNNSVADKMPLLVHCSAGVGRTGTFVAMDYLYQQAMAEEAVDVYDCVMKLREQRVNMVQTPTQYIFLHKAALEAVQPIGRKCSPELFSEMLQELKNISAHSTLTMLETEFNLTEQDTADNMVDDKLLQTATDNVYQNLTVEKYADSYLPENSGKSRDPNVLPDDSYRPRLLETEDCQSNYINAVWLQTYIRANSLIITQTPLPQTTVDFLRLVWDNYVAVVVMMETDFPMHQTGIYWEKKTVGPFAIDVIAEQTLNNYILRDIRINLLGEERTFQQIQYTEWHEEANLPKSISSFLDFFDEVNKSCDSTAPLVVHCVNGADRSGLYCVLFDIIERLKTEREVAIAETVRSMKFRRPQVIPNEEQYMFCYDVIDEHLRSSLIYANVL